MTKKLNLLRIAKQTEKDFTEAELTIDGEVYKEKVYKVPNPVIWSYLPDTPEPQLPTVLMQADVTGRRQSRPMKEGDEGWSEYQKAVADYDKEANDIQWAARYVLALADINYPDLSTAPPLALKNGVTYPDNIILRKKMWLDYTIFLNQANLIVIQAAFQELVMSDMVTSDQVEDVKKNSESTTEIVE